MSKSYLERITDALIKEASIRTPIKEFRLCVDRRWRCDYVWMFSEDRFPLKGVILEVEGGIWMKKGGHNTGAGITRDIEKYNEAALLGFIVLRAAKEHLVSGEAMVWVKRALAL